MSNENDIKESIIYCPISNYYGTPYVKQTEDGKYVIGLDNWDEADEAPISKTFFNACKKEFQTQNNGS